MNWKKIEENIFKALMVFATVIIVGSFFLIVGTIVSKGFPALSWEMLSEIPSGDFYMGGEGGILNSILGSLYIAAGSSLLALIISVPIVIYINMYLKKSSWMGNLTRLGYDVLFGMPSIVYGAFGFTLMIYLGMRASLLGGIVTVTLLIIPIMVRTMDEVIRTVPKELFDASYSLGATRLETSRVVLKQVAPGILTAVLLAFGRGIGDVASVMFTAGFSNDIPKSLEDPASTLPLAVFNQLSSPVEEVQSRAYAAALVLTIIVLLISISARVLSKRLSKNKI
ncbi:MAG: phosphate ABC transporter permease PstA [Bacteroidetes bacterium]|nr:phosphate ABC transporter permease PstA [Bacteroidota bacterium]